MKDNFLIKATKTILDFMFFSGIIVFIMLPFILEYAEKHLDENFGRNFIPMLIVFGISGICGILIVGQLRKMMETVILKDCFIDKNVKSLKWMSIFSLCISVLFLIKMLFFPTIATIIIILVFFIAALFSHVLGIVFWQAVRYKEENDLTI